MPISSDELRAAGYEVQGRQAVRVDVERQPPSKQRMNRTEAAWACELEAERKAGSVAHYRFEAIKLRLADSTFYTPDYFVVLASGRVRVDEVKGGFIRDDAAVKVKVAAEQYPEFEFRIVQKQTKRQGGGWKIKPIGQPANQEKP